MIGALAGSLAICTVGGAIQYYQSVRQDWLRRAGVRSLRAYAQQHPEDTEAVFALSYRLTALGQQDDARAYMEKLVKAQPNNDAYWYGLARAAAASGHPLRAVEAYERLSTLKPLDPAPRYALGEIYAAAGLFNDALVEFNAAGKLQPPNDIASASWARSLARLGRPVDAWTMLSASVRKLPMQDGPYLLLGRLAEVLNKRSEAEPLLLKRIQVTRMYPVGYARAARARLIASDHPTAAALRDAEDTARRALQDSTRDPEFDAALGLVLMAKGDLPGARAAVQKGLARSRPHSDARQECVRLLVEVYRRLGRNQDAERTRAQLELEPEQDPRFRESWRSAVTSGSPRQFETLAAALSGAGRTADAAEVCRRGLTLPGGDPALALARQKYRIDAIQQLSSERAGPAPDAGLYPWAEN